MEEFWTEIRPRSIIDEFVCGEAVVGERDPVLRSSRPGVTRWIERRLDEADCTTGLRHDKRFHSARVLYEGILA